MDHNKPQCVKKEALRLSNNVINDEQSNNTVYQAPANALHDAHSMNNFNFISDCAESCKPPSCPFDLGNAESIKASNESKSNENVSDSSLTTTLHEQQLLSLASATGATSTRPCCFAQLSKQHAAAIKSAQHHGRGPVATPSLSSSSHNILCNFATGNANVFLMAAANNLSTVEAAAAAAAAAQSVPFRQKITPSSLTMQQIYNTRLMQATHDSMLMLHQSQLEAEKLSARKVHKKHRQKRDQPVDFGELMQPTNEQHLCPCCVGECENEDGEALLEPDIHQCADADGASEQQMVALPVMHSPATPCAGINIPIIAAENTREKTSLKQRRSLTNKPADSDTTSNTTSINDYSSYNQRWSSLAAGGIGAVRVFPPDFNAPCERSQVVPCTTRTPARVICEKFLSIPANALHVQFGSESAVRRLDMHECPLAIQNAFLKRIGFKINNASSDGLNGTNSNEFRYYRSQFKHDSKSDDDDEQDARQLGLSHELTYFVRFYAGKPNKDNTFSRRLLSACLLISSTTKLSAARKLLYKSNVSSTDMARIGGICATSGRWQVARCVLSGTRLLVYSEDSTTHENHKNHAAQSPAVYMLARGDVQIVPGCAQMSNDICAVASEPFCYEASDDTCFGQDQRDSMESFYSRTDESASFQQNLHLADHLCLTHNQNPEITAPYDRRDKLILNQRLLPHRTLMPKIPVDLDTNFKQQHLKRTPSFVLKLTFHRCSDDISCNHGLELDSKTNALGTLSAFIRSNTNKFQRRSTDQQQYLMPCAAARTSEISAISTSTVVSSSSSTSSTADSALANSVSSAEATNGGILHCKNDVTAGQSQQHARRELGKKQAKSKKNSSVVTKKQKSLLLGFDTEHQMLHWFTRLKRATAKQPQVADLSSNHLEYLPENLFASSQEDLVQLNLRNNMLKERPIEEDIFTIGWLDDLPRFTALRSLNIANNELNVFPSSICRLAQLVELNISSNSIEEVSSAIKNLANLRILQLHGNRLTDLPLEMAYLHNLSVLVLSFNRFCTAPQVLASMPQLDSLIINGNRIADITYETCTRLRNITKIDLRLNRLRTPPDTQQQHSNVDLTHNSSSQAAYSLLNFQNLRNNNILRFDLLSGTTHLDLRSNKNLTHLDLLTLHQLQYFNASFCSLKTVYLSGTNLLFADVSNNDLQQFLVLPQPNRLISLNLSRNSLAKLPEWAGDIRHITHLDCSHNCLIGLPQRILYNGYSLRALNASHNQLHCLPYRVENCVLLEELNVAHNRLTSLPEPLLASCHKLKVLNITHNRFSFLPLPNAFVDVNRIQVLNASFNALDDRIWDVVRLLPRLRTLHLAHNRLRQSPARLFGHWPSLEELNVSGNFLSNLPNDLFLATHLTSLYAHSNNLHRLPDTSQNLRLRHCDLSFNPLEFHLNRNATNRRGDKLRRLSGGDGGGGEGRVKVHFQQNDESAHHQRTRSKSGAAKVSKPQQSSQPAVPAEITDKNFLLPMWQCGAAETSGLRARMCITRIKQPLFCTSSVRTPPSQESEQTSSALFALIDGGHSPEVPDKIQHLLPTLIINEWSKLQYKKAEDSTIQRSKKHVRSRTTERKSAREFDTAKRTATSNRRRSSTRDHSSRRSSRHHRISARASAPTTDTCGKKSESNLSAQYSSHLRKALLYAAANIGGAEAIISRADGQLQLLSQSFRPSAVDAREIDRVCAAGGLITDDDRVNASSQHTRLLGAHFLYPVVIADPYCSAIQLDANDEFAIIANEAFWLACTYEEAATLVREKLLCSHELPTDHQRMQRNMSDACYATQIAKSLIDLALSYGGGNCNLSVMVVLFNIPTSPPISINNHEQNDIDGAVGECGCNTAKREVEANQTTSSVSNNDAASGGGVGTLRSDGTLFYDSTACIELPLPKFLPPNVTHHNGSLFQAAATTSSSSSLCVSPRRSAAGCASLPTSDPANSDDGQPADRRREKAENVNGLKGDASNYGSAQNSKLVTTNNSPDLTSSAAASKSASTGVTNSNQPPKSTVSTFKPQLNAAASSKLRDSSHRIGPNNNNESIAGNADTDTHISAESLLRRHRSSLRVTPKNIINTTANSSTEARKPSPTKIQQHEKPATEIEEIGSNSLHINGVLSRWKLQQAANAQKLAAASSTTHHDLPLVRDTKARRSTVSSIRHDEDSSSAVYEKVDDASYYENIYASVANNGNVGNFYNPAGGQTNNGPAQKSSPPSPPPLPPDMRRNSNAAEGDVLMLAKLKRRKDILSAAGDAERRAREEKERTQKCLLDELQTVLLRRRMLADADEKAT